MSEDKLSIRNEMAQFDRKNRDFYDELDDQEKKKFSPWLMIRYGSTVQGSPAMQGYYVSSCNENLNKNFYNISTKEHKKFQWLMATTVSPNLGNQYHQWIPPKKKTTDNKAVNFLSKIHPHLKEDEIRLLAEINDPAELKAYAKEMGWTDKDIKREL